MSKKRTDAEWRKILSPEQYRILRESGTEPAFSGHYNECKDQGVYRCAGCGTPLFSSATKFKSGSGWPSFHSPLHGEAIKEESDSSHAMERTEVLCKACGGQPEPAFWRILMFCGEFLLSGCEKADGKPQKWKQPQQQKIGELV